MYRTTHPPPELVEPRTVEEIIADINGRRDGFFRAFFIDVDTVYALCNPKVKEKSLCLYTYPNATWDVSPPVLDLPLGLPKPFLGINFKRDRMLRNTWLQFVACQCDVWLLSLAFFFGRQLDKNERIRLYDLFDDRASVLEQVTNRPEP